MSEIKISVSIGEAIDKLTILEIKLEKIKDERRNDVELEYNYLQTELSGLIQEFKYYYKFLKNVNLEIWELQDEIRKDSSYISSKCEEILFLNDARFTIKNKINNISKSKFKEQKGYNKRRVIILTDKSSFNKERFYHIDAFYDETLILCNEDIEIQNVKIQKYEEEEINKYYNNSLDFYNYINCNEKYKNKISHPYLKNKILK
jgi:hypothetical protein